MREIYRKALWEASAALLLGCALLMSILLGGMMHCLIAQVDPSLSFLLSADESVMTGSCSKHPMLSLPF